MESSVSKKPINEFDDMPKKLDQSLGLFKDTPMPMSSGVYVDPDFDPGQKEMKGINETVKLKKSSKKIIKPEPKKEKIKFELPAKKPKQPIPKDPSPPPRVSPTQILPPKIGINGFNGVGR